MLLSDLPIQDKSVLITGGLGMIGSTIALMLVKQGASVTILDASLSPYGANRFNIRDIAGQVELVHGDIRDFTLMSRLVQGQDVIFNLAGQVSHNDSLTDPFWDLSINYTGHLNVAEAARLHNPSTRIVYSGSRLQFGKIKEVPVDESHPQTPETPYALHKSVAEQMYGYYYRIHGVQSACFRIANPYGIRSQMKHSKYTIVNWFIRQAMENKTLTIFGEGHQVRDYIYVEDLATALIAAGFNPDIEHVSYNVGSGTGTTFAEMVHLVVDTVGSGEVVHIDWPDNYKNVETGDYITDISKLTTELGWQPQVSLQEGIEKTYAYYKQYKEHYW